MSRSLKRMDAAFPTVFRYWLVVLTLVVVAIVGCGSIDGKSPPEEDADNWHYITVPVPDGKPVVCVVSVFDDAISCDWAHR